MNDGGAVASSRPTAGEGQPLWRRALSPGCFIWGAGIATALFLAVWISGLIFSEADEGAGPGARGINVGPADEYALGDVNEFDQERLFLVRLPNGEFMAFSSMSARQQELNGSCRIYYDETATPGAVAQISGMRGAFVEECEGNRAVWRVDGAFAFGAGYGDLDRFQVVVDDAGDLRIDTSERTCTRSRGVPGIPPFEVRRCQGAP